MLNAFRHQRIKHAAIAVDPSHGAVVLNAFRHQRIKHRVCTVVRFEALGGAQRLSASTDKTLALDTETNGLDFNVLNAFRHQRIKHSLEGEKRVVRGCVLNAFRHQRIKHN